jgi:hypothetical protein
MKVDDVFGRMSRLQFGKSQGVEESQPIIKKQWWIGALSGCGSIVVFAFDYLLTYGPCRELLPLTFVLRRL